MSVAAREVSRGRFSPSVPSSICINIPARFSSHTSSEYAGAAPPRLLELDARICDRIDGRRATAGGSDSCRDLRDDRDMPTVDLRFPEWRNQHQ